MPNSPKALPSTSRMAALWLSVFHSWSGLEKTQSSHLRLSSSEVLERYGGYRVREGEAVVDDLHEPLPVLPGEDPLPVELGVALERYPPLAEAVNPGFMALSSFIQLAFHVH